MVTTPLCTKLVRERASAGDGGLDPPWITVVSEDKLEFDVFSGLSLLPWAAKMTPHF